MKNSEKQKQLEKLIKEGKRDERESLIWFQSGRTVKSVDFQHIENNPYGTEPLTPFELEVKEKLASAPSPFDELARQEDEVELEHEEKSLRTKMAHLVKGTKLSPRQKQCYELLYVERRSEREIRKLLGIRQVRLCQIKKEIEAALIESYRTRKEKSRPTLKSRANKLTLRQKEVLELKERGLTMDQIGRHLGVTKQGVYSILKGVQKKLLPRRNG